jgi:hypothetical protein
MEVLFDHAFDRGWALGLRTRVLAPLPADGKASGFSRDSTIEMADTPRIKLKWWRKAPTLWWRTKNEVMRVLFALHAAVRQTAQLRS